MPPRLYLRQDAAGTFTGTLRATQLWTLERDGNHPHTAFRNEIFDVDGNLVTTIEGQAEATRFRLDG